MSTIRFPSGSNCTVPASTGEDTISTGWYWFIGEPVNRYPILSL
ncbi:MAG TPA: hypothetical protein PLQ40_09620 [Ferruginibacter sp.]|nr:hypothetical protein [Ferruginibacter sp.]